MWCSIQSLIYYSFFKTHVQFRVKIWLVLNIVCMFSHVCCLVFLLTVLFCRLVRSYTKLNVDTPKLHGLKYRLCITIHEIKCCCVLIILLTRLVECVQELLVLTELLTTCMVYGSPKRSCTCLMRYKHYSFYWLILYCLITNLVSSCKQL